MTRTPAHADTAPTPDGQPARRAPGEPPVIRSAELFRRGNAVRIEHAGQHYLLRITRENKLILTK